MRIDKLNARLGSFALDDISLNIGKGEYHILLGPTGSGKTSLMKCILGFNKIESGKIYLHDRDITSELPERRRMGYVPQNYALFPHLNAQQNLSFGLAAQKISAKESRTRVDRMCRILGIESLRQRSVTNLSGGERQKVALGRALITRPEIILLDEPFSSIDEGSKRNLWIDLSRVISEVQATVVHITHNLEEAYSLGERLSVLIRGKLVQSGPKREIFERPASEDIARYLSYRNIFEGTALDYTEGARIDLGHWNLLVRENIPAGKKVKLCIRQHDIKVIRQDRPIKESLKRNILSGRIVRIFALPEYCLLWLKLEHSPHDYDLELKLPIHILGRHNLHAGERITVALWEPSIIVF